MPLIFSQADLDVMARVRSAIDPSGRLNPAKILPVGEHHSPTRAGAARTIPEGMWI
jgi:hypothetical protein